MIGKAQTDPSILASTQMLLTSDVRISACGMEKTVKCIRRLRRNGRVESGRMGTDHDVLFEAFYPAQHAVDLQREGYSQIGGYRQPSDSVRLNIERLMFFFKSTIGLCE